jgi:site-specific recombinase XerD
MREAERRRRGSSPESKRPSKSAKGTGDSRGRASWVELPHSGASIEHLIKSFEIRNLCLNRSPKTVSWYTNNLNLFVKYRKDQGHSLLVEDITHPEVQEYVLSLRGKNRYDQHPLTPRQEGKLSPQTVRAHIATLKAFFNWLHREGYIDRDLSKQLESPKVPRKLKEVLTKEEVERLLRNFDRRTPIGCRNSTILMMLLDTGLRCSELTNLRFTDVHVDRAYVKVMGKGATERIVPMGSASLKALIEYTQKFRPRPAHPKINNVFLSESGSPIAANTVQLMLKRHGQRCGVPRIHPHLCRHTFATSYLVNGGDVFTLQSILGHSSLEMVRQYVSLASGFVVMQHHRFSPLDMMRPRINSHPRRRLSFRSAPSRATD